MSLTAIELYSGSEDDDTESDSWWNTPVSTYRKKRLLRALSSLEAMKRRDEPEVAREIVARQLDHHLKGRALPPLITDFLETYWRVFMTQLYMAEGEESEAWHEALENTEDLTWSLQPKHDHGSRKRFYALLPELTQWLHTVLESQQVCAADEDAFFAELAQAHVATLSPDSQSDSGPGSPEDSGQVDLVDGASAPLRSGWPWCE